MNKLPWLAAALLLVASSQSQQKVGPMVGLRIPVWDYSQNRYLYLKMNPEQFVVDVDPAGTSDGVLSTKGAGRYVFGSRFVVAGTDPAYVSLDTAFVMHRVFFPNGLPPVAGTSCDEFGTGAVCAGRFGLFVCIDVAGQGKFTWARANLEVK